MYENQNYETILGRVLGRVPETLDTRESSFLYNASAPVAIELVNMYLSLDNILKVTFFDTADREGKLQRCKERGIDLTQFDAIPSVCNMKVSPIGLDIPLGTRFNYEEINFIVTEKLEDSLYRITCEQAGVIGNVTGEVIPMDYISGLQTAEITSIYIWGRDELDESEIDKIFYASFNSQAFGGNRYDYMQKMKSITGVGGVKVYSAGEWMGGGTVKLVFSTSTYTKPSDDFVDSVQTIIDPLVNQGAGYGVAPIGHTVTVEGVNEELVNVTTTIVLQEGYEWDDVKDYVSVAIDKYLGSLNEQWEDSSNIIVRISQIETRILDIAGIIDIYDTSLNGSEQNLTLDKDSIAVRGDINATS